METGVNQLNFISSYSPIADDQGGHYRAAPEYYGMLAFAMGCHGERVGLSYEAGAVNLTAYSTLHADGILALVVVNKDETTDADVRIVSRPGITSAQVLRLAAPSLISKESVTLGRAEMNGDVQWHGHADSARTRQGICSVRVPAASAAIVRLRS
jgi:hypothetical protein